MIPAVARTTDHLSTRAYAIQTRASVAVLLHGGVVPLKKALIGEWAVFLVVFVIWKKRVSMF